MLYLVGDLFGRKIRYPLREDCARITGGSLPDNDLYLPYRGVSRRHFLLEKKDGGWSILDLKSRNGVVLNGTRTARAALRPGDVLGLGIIEIQVAEGVEDAAWLPLKDVLPAPVGTDETGTQDIGGHASALVFPDLVFPEGYIPGPSLRMVEVYQKIHILAPGSIPILLIGETGVGKEMLARGIHLSGPRAQGPFVAVNCAAIPTELAEAELFGIGERVATGVAGRIGRFRMAEKGTLFLDELSAFPPPIQAKILRAVEEPIIFPVGCASGAKVDFRLISATNKDPRELMRQGLLREDLYHRLAGMEIAIPPLRDRREDIEGLILGLLHRFSEELNKPLGGITKKLLSMLIHRDYPGNVRELSKLLNGMAARAYPGEILDVALLPQSPDKTEQDDRSLHQTLEKVSKSRIIEALRMYHGNITHTAHHLGLSNVGLRSMMKRLGITKEGI